MMTLQAESVGEERIHLDLEADDVEAEVKRLEVLGRYLMGPPDRTRLRLGLRR
jgi:hypothetical protein